MPRSGDDAITFDRADTLHSAMGKLESFAVGQAYVHLAPGCRIAGNPLTYRLIARTAVRLGAPIPVVTRNPGWRRLARVQGLRAYSSPAALQRRYTNRYLSIFETIVDTVLCPLFPTMSKQGWVNAAIAVAIVLFAAYMFVPVMTVSVRAPLEPLTRVATIKVDAAVKAVDSSSLIIPGKIVEHRFTVSDKVSTTGDGAAGKDRATGEITLINYGPRLVEIPNGAIALTKSGVRFTVGNGVNLPAAARIKLPVVAEAPGEAGNVPSMSISSLDGAAFKSVTVYNEAATKGGSNQKARQISTDDRSRLKEALFQRAQSIALSELTVRVSQAESLIPHSMQVRVEKEEYDKNPGDEGDSLSGTVSVAASAIVFANQDLNSVVDKAWKKELPKDSKLVAGSLDMSPPEIAEAASRTATLRVKATGKLEPTVDTDDLAQSVRGLSMEESRAKLAKMDGNLKLEKVDLWPAWSTRAYRVNVVTLR